MVAGPSYAEFTEDAFRELVRLAASRYAFTRFPAALEASDKSILWRHDIDFSPHRALALARIEAEEGAQATYFVSLHSAFYNALERDVAERFRAIRALGHDVALHFDPAFYANGHDLVDALTRERALLVQLIGAPIDAFSLHAPELAGWTPAEDVVGGLVNTYGKTLRARYSYVSDSNGYWRFRNLREVLEAAEEPCLHALTHPEWWVPEPLSPRDRVSRAIDGRAAYQHARYDRVIEAMGRENIR